MNLEPTQPPAHVDSVPPPTGWRVVTKFLVDWATAWAWLPLAFLLIWLFAQGAYLIQGRKPQENVDWIMGIAGNALRLVVLTLFVEVLRQQTGKWWKAEDLKTYPHLAWTSTVSKCVSLLVGAYILSH